MFVMENICAFANAALPWVTMGLLVAFLAARSVSEKRGESAPENYAAEGISIGMSLGVCIGTMFDNVGLGISLGMLAGLAVGSGIQKKQDGKK